MGGGWPKQQKIEIVERNAPILEGEEESGRALVLRAKHQPREVMDIRGTGDMGRKARIGQMAMQFQKSVNRIVGRYVR